MAHRTRAGRMCRRGPDNIVRRTHYLAAEAVAEFDTSELTTDGELHKRYFDACGLPLTFERVHFLSRRLGHMSSSEASHWFWNRCGNGWTPVDVLRSDFQNQSNKFKYLGQNPFFYHKLSSTGHP
jgi:hypothetical protein